MADGISAKVEGLGAIGSAIEQQMADVAQRARVAMVAEAAAIAADAVNRVPVDTGELRDSVFIKPTQDGAEVGFSAPHAVYVHERLDVEHKDGEAKFLEHAKDAASTQLVQRVAERAKVGG